MWRYFSKTYMELLLERDVILVTLQFLGKLEIQIFHLEFSRRLTWKVLGIERNLAWLQAHPTFDKVWTWWQLSTWIIFWSYDDSIVNFSNCCTVYSAVTWLWATSCNTLPVKRRSRSRTHQVLFLWTPEQEISFIFLTSWPHFLKALFICLDYLRL